MATDATMAATGYAVNKQSFDGVVRNLGTLIKRIETQIDKIKKFEFEDKTPDEMIYMGGGEYRERLP